MHTRRWLPTVDQKHARVHPCTAALLSRARVGVEVKVRLGLPSDRHREKAHVWVPHSGETVCGDHVHIKEALDKGKQAVEDVGEGKVWAQLLVADVVPANIISNE